MGKFKDKSKSKHSRYNPCGQRPDRKKSKKEPAGLNVIFQKISGGVEVEVLHSLNSLAAIVAEGIDAVTAVLDYGTSVSVVASAGSTSSAGSGASAGDNVDTSSGMKASGDAGSSASSNCERPLVSCVTACLQHQSQHVRLAAAGAIRNLSACGDEDKVMQLLQTGVLQALCTLLQSYKTSSDSGPTVSQSLDPNIGPSLAPGSVPSQAESPHKHEVEDVRLQVLEQAAYILYNLCEVSEDAVAAAGAAGVVAVLAGYSGSVEAGRFSLTLAVNTALLCLTEDNPEACECVRGYAASLAACVAAYTAEAGAAYLHNCLTAAGILTNLGLCEPVTENWTATMRLIEASLALPPSKLLNKYVNLSFNATSGNDTGSSNTNSSDTKRNGNSDIAQQNGVSNSRENIDIGSLSNITLRIDDLPQQQKEERGDVDDDTDMQTTEEGGAGSTSAGGLASVKADDDEVLTLEMEHCLEAGGAMDNGCVSSKAWQEVQAWLAGQQLALELLNNMSCAPDEEWEKEVEDALECVDMKESLGEEEEEEEGMEGAGEGQERGPRVDNKGDVEVHPQVVQQVVERQMVQLVLATLEPIEPPVLTALRDSRYHSQLADSVAGVVVRGLAAVQTLLGCLATDQLPGPLLLNAWPLLARLAFTQHTQPLNAGVLEGATGAMRAVVGKLGGQDAAQLLQSITMEDIQLLMGAGQSCGAAAVRSNLARLLGELCCLLLSLPGPAEHPLRTPVISQSTDYLMKVAGADPELWVSAEALDVLVDVYSDDQTDRLALDVNLLARLRVVMNFFNARYKKERGTAAAAAHRVLLLTVRDNMPAFIRYKEPRVLNLDPSKQHACKGGPLKNKNKAKKKEEKNKNKMQ